MKSSQQIITALVLSAVVALGPSCSTLSLTPDRPVSQSLKPATSGKLAQVSAGARVKHGSEKSAFHLIKRNDEAMRWRLALIDHATTSIDTQYFIWERDESGLLLLSHLLEAADRGVRVRLLVDDFMLKSKSKNLAALCHHPNFKIRIFNPQYVQSGKIVSTLEFVFRFGKLNRRMHNKLIVADNRLAIMGGRNIGNEYFGLSKKYNYLDLGVLVTGNVLTDISAGFDEFWNSKEAYPGVAMSASVSQRDTAKAMASVRKKLSRHSDVLAKVNLPMEQADWSPHWKKVSSKWHVGTATVVQDAPHVSVWKKRKRFLDDAHRLTDPDHPKEFLAISPYLIPGKKVYGWIERNASRGATVKIATASLAAADQPWVYAHYANHRRRMMNKGAMLYEFRGDAKPSIKTYTDFSPIQSKKVSLHVKGGIGDSTKCYIGSLNLDPRSIDLNTENGLIIHSPSLSRELRKHFFHIMSEENSWSVQTSRPTGKGKMQWSSRGVSTETQPAPSVLSRLGQRVFGSLPIKSQL
jgi:putative cardiolipin synthase